MENIPVIFHNLKDRDSHFIMQEIGKFDVKISIIPNGLEKCTAFTINKNLVFIDRLKFLSSSLDTLLKNVSDNDFKACVLCLFVFFQIFIFLPNDSPSKIINVFYFIKKIFWFSRYSNFCNFFPFHNFQIQQDK